MRLVVRLSSTEKELVDLRIDFWRSWTGVFWRGRFLEALHFQIRNADIMKRVVCDVPTCGDRRLCQ